MSRSENKNKQCYLNVKSQPILRTKTLYKGLRGEIPRNTIENRVTRHSKQFKNGKDFNLLIYGHDIKHTLICDNYR